ncbi:MAG: hypothetical protein C5B59_17345 [Bacteroidetes bacterium]|nr:MAG: hypothetical protein C5B59_17345 [Bacteroidota bacterium]
MKIFLNFDKAGAEWVVVAYLSGDARMLDVVENGKKPHVVTGNLIFGVPDNLILAEKELIGELRNPVEIEELRQSIPDLSTGGYFLPRTMSVYQAGKKSNHALNYGETYRVFALYNEMDESEAKRIVDFYHEKAYPSISVWHESIRRELKRDRTLTNCFGRKVVLRDTWGPHLFKAGYAFKPQSTVVDMVNRALRRLYEEEIDGFRYTVPKAQVHDSILAQTELPNNHAGWVRLASVCMSVDSWMSPTCRYGSREFTVKTDMKLGPNWGRMSEVKLAGFKDPDALGWKLEEAWDGLHAIEMQKAG